MAQVPPVAAAFVIDTGYLVEFFEVPGHSNAEARQEVLARLRAAIRVGHRLYVPLSCLFELGNHIAQVDDGTARRAIAHTVRRTVRTSVEDGTPWIITPAVAIEALPALLDSFADRYVDEQVGLTDTQVIEIAHGLKEQFRQMLRVHIWTTDNALKAREPDREPDPFVGGS